MPDNNILRKNIFPSNMCTGCLYAVKYNIIIKPLMLIHKPRRTDL